MRAAPALVGHTLVESLGILCCLDAVLRVLQLFQAFVHALEDLLFPFFKYLCVHLLVRIRDRRGLARTGKTGRVRRRMGRSARINTSL